MIEPATKILTVSSNRTVVKQQLPGAGEFEDSLLGEDYEHRFLAAPYIDDTHSHSLAYMASVLEAKIIGGKRRLIKCDECISSFIQNELMEDSFIRFKARRSNIMQPCRSTFEICKIVDQHVKSCEKISFSYQILRKIQFDTLYPSSNFENHVSDDINHKYEFNHNLRFLVAFKIFASFLFRLKRYKHFSCGT